MLTVSDGQPYGWGLGNCLPHATTAHPWLQASPWVSKQEVTQLGLPFLAASLPGIPSFRQLGKTAVPQRVRPHPTEDSGAGAGCAMAGGGPWEARQSFSTVHRVCARHAWNWSSKNHMRGRGAWWECRASHVPHDRLGYFILGWLSKTTEKGMLHLLWDKLRVSEWCSQDSHLCLTPDVHYLLSQSPGCLHLHNEPMTPGGFFPPLNWRSIQSSQRLLASTARS